MRHVLIVEDNRTIAEGLRRNLEIEGHRVTLAYDGDEGLARAAEPGVDLVILDLMLPRVDGFRVLATLRAAGRDVPVLVLSAKGSDVDKVKGFRLGADDYVVKPFGLLELLGRVKALLRRSGARSPEEHLSTSVERFGDIEVRRGERVVLRRGTVVELRPKEYELLVALLDRDGEAASRQSLLREVWEYDDSVVTRTVDSHVVALRQRLENDPANPRHLLTVRKVGYRLAR
jgi:DNA-binding response OmpR family regulator